MSQIECPQLGAVSLACRTVADLGLSDSCGHCDGFGLTDSGGPWLVGQWQTFACRTVADLGLSDSGGHCDGFGLSDSGGPWLVGQWRTL